MILAMDTTQGACSVAVLDLAGDVLAFACEDMAQGHAERLVPMVDAVVLQGGVHLSQMTRIATTIGPGTFTGLRVGLAAARGYGVALDVPVIGVTTLEALVATASLTMPARVPPRPWVAMIDARRHEVYMQAFSATGAPLSEAARQPVTQALATLPKEPFFVVGTAAPQVCAISELAAGCDVYAPDARAVGRLSLGRPATVQPPEALYLRAPDAKLPGGIIPPGFDV